MICHQHIRDYNSYKEEEFDCMVHDLSKLTGKKGMSNNKLYSKTSKYL